MDFLRAIGRSVSLVTSSDELSSSEEAEDADEDEDEEEDEDAEEGVDSGSVSFEATNLRVSVQGPLSSSTENFL